MKIDWTSKPNDATKILHGSGLEALSSAQPQAPNADDLEQWKKLFKPPFKFDPKGTTVFDKDNHMVCQIRGWGRISSQKGEMPGADIQDAFGHKLAEMITSLYSNPTPLTGDTEK